MRCLARPRSVCTNEPGGQLRVGQAKVCSTATSMINTGMFTVVMRSRREAGKLASAGGRLPSVKGACARRERAAHAGSQRRSYFGALDQGL